MEYICTATPLTCMEWDEDLRIAPWEWEEGHFRIRFWNRGNGGPPSEGNCVKGGLEKADDLPQPQGQAPARAKAGLLRSPQSRAPRPPSQRLCRRRSEAGRSPYLAREKDGRGHFLHGQVPDAGGQGSPARGATAQLLSALVAHQVPGLALQDRGKHIVKAHGALEERGELVVLRRHRPPTAFAASRARDHGGGGRHRGGAGSGSRDGGGGCGGGSGGGGGSSSWGRRVLLLLLAARFVSARSGGGRAAHLGRNKPSNCGHRAGRSPKARRGPSTGSRSNTPLSREPLLFTEPPQRASPARRRKSLQRSKVLQRSENEVPTFPPASSALAAAPSPSLPRQPFPLNPRAKRAWFLLTPPRHPSHSGTVI